MHDAALCAYIPVIHRGYLGWLDSHPDLSVYVVNRGMIEDFRGSTDIRALDPELIVQMLVALGYNARLLSHDGAWKLGTIKLFMPREVMSQKLANNFQLKVTYENVWLRWEQSNVRSQSMAEHPRQTIEPRFRDLLKLVGVEAEKSSDWWRQVGGILLSADGEVLYRTHNRHLPTDHTPYIDGDPRDVIEAGFDSHLTTALHCEQDIVAWCAASGMSMKGLELVLGVYPCPMCARLVSRTGISKIYFGSGHASLGGEEVLSAAGITTILVR